MNELKRKADSDDDDGGTSKRMKFEKEEDVDEKNYLVDFVLDFLDKKEAEAKVAEEAANEKKRKREDDHSPPRGNEPNDFLEAIHDGNSPKRARRTEDLPKSEDTPTEACAGQRTENYDNGATANPLEHDDSTMERSSPCNSRKHQRSSSAADVVDLSKDSQQSQHEQEQGDECGSSGDPLSYGDYGEVISAKKLPRKPDRKGNGDCVPASLKSVSPGKVGTLRSGLGFHLIEVGNASGEGDVHDQKDQKADSSAKGEEWSYFDYAKNRKPSNIRTYAQPKSAAPERAAVGTAEARSMGPGQKFGPRPHNTLGGSEKSTSTPNNPPNKKAFDLTGHADDYHTNKRQKIEGTRTLQNGSSESPIDLEDPSVNSNIQMGPPPSNAGYSQGSTRRGSQHNGVQEFRKVEDTVGFNGRRGKNKSSDSLNSSGSGRFMLQKASEKQHHGYVGKQPLYVEDAEDPIEDEDADREVPHQKKKSLQTPKKVNMEVQIPASQKGRTSTGDQDTSNRQTSQPTAKELSNGDSKTLGEVSTASKHFLDAHGRGKRGHATGSPSTGDAGPASASPRVMKQQNGSSSTQTAPSRPPTGSVDPNLTFDELNPDERVGEKLLREYKRVNVSKIQLNGTGPRHESITLDESSDDVLSKNPDDITKSKFVSSSKTKSTMAARRARHALRQVFSKSYIWLDTPMSSSWQMFQDEEQKSFIAWDGSGSIVPDLELPLSSMSKFVRARNYSKLVIFKSKDQTVKGAHQIFLEFVHSTSCEEFVEEMAKLFPYQSRHEWDIVKSSEHLDKVFENSLREAHSQMRRSSSRKDPEDLMLAQAKSEKRHSADRQKIQNRKEAIGGRLIGQVQTNQDAHMERDARARRPHPSIQYYDLDDGDLSQKFDPPHFLSDALYGSRRETRSSHPFPFNETGPSTRTSPREPHPRQSRPPSPVRWTHLNPGWEEKWGSTVLYPPEGKNKARVDMGDIAKLDDGQYLNDNLISFQIRRLQVQLEEHHPEWAKRVYFQNTFFYERLTNPEPGKKGINFDAVKRWTAKVDIFSYDYIVVPVCENNHWYMAIICNAPKLLPGAEETHHAQSQENNDLGDEPTDLDAESRQGAMRNEQSERFGHSTDVVEIDGPPPANITSDLVNAPTLNGTQRRKLKRKSNPSRKNNSSEFRILTFDSLGSSRTQTCSNIKDYLVMEMKDKKGITIDRPGAVGMTAKNIPSQDNFHDCGLFVLSYIERFMEDPDAFVTAIVQNDPDVRNWKWREALELRNEMRENLLALSKETVSVQKPGKGKAKGKPVCQNESASTSNSTSREATKSAGASPDRRSSDAYRDSPDSISKPIKDVATKQEPPTKSAIIGSPAMNHVSESVPTVPRENLITKTAKAISKVLGRGEANASAQESSPKQPENVIEIPESPQKGAAKSIRRRPQDVHMQAPPRSSAEGNNGHSQDRRPNTDRVGKLEIPEPGHKGNVQTKSNNPASPKKRSIHEISDEESNNHLGCRRLDHAQPAPRDSGAIDLRSPSPEILSSPSHHGSTEEHQSSSTSPGSDEPHPSKKRRPSPKKEEELRGAREIRSSVDLDNDDIDFINVDDTAMRAANNKVETNSADEEMLLQDGPPTPPFLSSSPAAESSSHITKKQQRHRSHSASPTRTRQKEVKKGFKTDPATPRKRKNIADQWQHLDPAAKAVLGRHVSGK